MPSRQSERATCVRDGCGRKPDEAENQIKSSIVRLTVLWCWAVGSEPHYLVVSHHLACNRYRFPLSCLCRCTMEGFSSFNGRASGRTARERSDRKRAKKRSRRDLELRFDDLPSPAYDDSFYRVPVDRRWSRSRGLIHDSGYDSSDAAVAWVQRVTCNGRCLDERREQDRRAGVGALGRLPLARLPACRKPGKDVCLRLLSRDEP